MFTTKGALTEMKCIYASKLYKSSKRKDTISAALANSSNVGLVQQLITSLDEEYQAKEFVDPEDPEADNSEGTTSESGDAGTSSSGGQAGGSSGGSLGGSFSSGLGGEFNPETDLVEFPEGEESSESEDSEVADSGDEDGVIIDEGPDDGVKESTQIKACTLDASQLNILRESLNLVESLSGVTRIVIKDSELWIYYNDDTNLNNIMTDVIEYMLQCYPQLEFNRLARSDNAIVFEIAVSSSSTKIA